MVERGLADRTIKRPEAKRPRHVAACFAVIVDDIPRYVHKTNKAAMPAMMTHWFERRADLLLSFDDCNKGSMATTYPILAQAPGTLDMAT